jgi:outer membrane protein assembly factor BamE (lipoprotein component of BamABCDE complex)
MRLELKMTIFGALLAGALLGCASVGREFPVERVPQIEIGRTNREEIRALFGAPWRTGLEDGQLTWTFAKYHYSLFGGTSTEDLVVRFDDRGTVVSYTFNTTEHEEKEEASDSGFRRRTPD